MNSKHTHTKYTALIVTMAMMLGTLGLVAPAHQAEAQCLPGEGSGNVAGYAMTETIGPIYMNTQTWNDDPLGEGNTTSTEPFSVSYDRSTGLWDGRGWNKHVGWVDFGQMNTGNSVSRVAELWSLRNNPAWGNWHKTIYLNNVHYTTDPGRFDGIGTNQEFTVDEGGAGTDDLVGTGDVDFSNVILDPNPNPDCNERVDVLLNGVNTLYKKTCPIPKPTIQWTSEDVSGCTTDEGLWAQPHPDGPRQPSGSETASGDITTANNPVTFRLKCIGDESGNVIYGKAIASCGPVDDTNPTCIGCGTGGGGIDPTDGIIIPEFREV